MHSPLEQTPPRTFRKGDRVRILDGLREGEETTVTAIQNRAIYVEDSRRAYRYDYLELLPPIEQKTAARSIALAPRVIVTVPPEPDTAVEPGDRISTRSGVAVVTAVEPVGKARVVHADYGSGIPQPHRVEDLQVGAIVQADLTLFGELCHVQGVIIAAPDRPSGTATMEYTHELEGIAIQGEVQMLRARYTPIEQREQDADDAIATIEQQIMLIKNAGEIAPDLCWLECAPCHKRKSKQVFYRASQPIFNGKKCKYVGMEGSGKAIAAGNAIARRNELKSLKKQLEILKGRND